MPGCKVLWIRRRELYRLGLGEVCEDGGEVHQGPAEAWRGYGEVGGTGGLGTSIEVAGFDRKVVPKWEAGR